MPFSRRHLRSSTRLALLAMLAFALVPGLSRMLSQARAGSVGWGTICSVQAGPRAAPVDASPAEPGSGEAVAHLDACALCSLAGHAPALPPPGWPSTVSAAGDGAPLWFDAVAWPLPARSSVQARAPPVFAA